MSRITLITKFKEKELNNQLKNIHYHMCKVPYGINDELRNEIDKKILFTNSWREL